MPRTPNIYYKTPIDTVQLSVLLFTCTTLHSVCLTHYNSLSRNESAVDRR
jgi:hypothetical protein